MVFLSVSPDHFARSMLLSVKPSGSLAAMILSARAWWPHSTGGPAHAFRGVQGLGMLLTAQRH